MLLTSKSVYRLPWKVISFILSYYTTIENNIVKKYRNNKSEYHPFEYNDNTEETQQNKNTLYKRHSFGKKGEVNSKQIHQSHRADGLVT